MFVQAFKLNSIRTVLYILIFSTFDMVQKNLVLQQFSEKERKHLSMKKDGTKDKKLAPDQELVGYLPVILRGNDYSPYYKTSGLIKTDTKMMELDHIAI